jgi:hypothetical protein
MSNEHYVTLFSNSSADVFSSNTLTSFTNNLYPSLDLKPLGKWKVGLTDISHSLILDSKYIGEDDKIKFPETMNQHGVIDFSKFIFYCMMFAKNHSIYTKSYFNEFINVNLLQDFPLNFMNFKTSINDHKKIFKVLIAEIKTTENDIIKMEVDYDTSITYSMHQIIFKIFMKLEEILLDNRDKLLTECEYFNQATCVQLYNTFKFPYAVDNKEMRSFYLHNIAINIIDMIEKIQHNFYKNKSPKHANYMFIYSDVISPRHIGQNFANILHICPIKEFDNQYTAIKNVQYYNVNKDIISDISIKIVDENGESMSFKSGFFPTAVTLHFKKD